MYSSKFEYGNYKVYEVCKSERNYPRGSKENIISSILVLKII